MKRASLIIAASVAALMIAPISAAAPVTSGPDPIISAYRDYKAAMDHDDLAGAEAAAARALGASEARDGGGKMTAVLAMNLANVMMDRDEKAQAIAPARRAYQLTRAGSNGVDELMARLVLGEAELSTIPEGDESALIAALRAAQQRSDLDDYAYPAASVLETAAIQTQNWKNAEFASLAVQRHLNGESGDKTLAKVRALTVQGLALVAQRDDEHADTVLTTALNVGAPLAPESPDFSVVSSGERAYAEALVMFQAERSRQLSEHSTPAVHKMVPRPSLPRPLPVCERTLIGRPSVKYPWEMQSTGGVGAAVIRVAIDSQGKVTKSDIMAIFPRGEIRKSVTDMPLSLRYVDKNGGKTPCDLASNDFLMSVRFTLQ